MAEGSTRIVMVLIGVAVAVFVVYRFILWLQASPKIGANAPIPLNEDIAPHPAVDLLEASGYEVVGGKLRVPLSFETGGQRLYSRLFIDYVAVDGEEQLYPVLLARPRRVVEWTGSGLRDAVLPYLLLYPDCGGVLYVDAQAGQIHRIALALDDGESD